MGDHEVDGADAEEYDQEGVKAGKIGAEIGDLPKNEVSCDPKEGDKDQQGVKGLRFLFQESPYMKLPGDEGPVHEGIDIDRDGIAVVIVFDQDEADDFGDKADP